MVELKPCPFCGKDNLKLMESNVYRVKDGTTDVFVFCLNCGGRTGSAPYDEALEKWNTRDGMNPTIAKMETVEG